MSISDVVKVWNISEIITTDFPEPKWLVPGIIQEGLTAIAGAPKVGKSWFALDLCTTVSQAGVILGKYQVFKPERTLYLSLEDTPRRLKTRLMKQGVIPGTLAHIVTGLPATMNPIDFLNEWMKTYPDTALIVIDTFQKFINVRDNNDYSQTVAAMGSIKKFADEYGISVITVHHAKKTRTEDFIHSLIGSIGLTATADSIITLTKKRGELDAILSATGRDIEDISLALKFDTGCCRWSAVGQAAEVADSKQRQDIIDLLRRADECMSPKQIAESLGKPQGNIRFLVMKMSEEGQIHRANRGLYTVISTNNNNYTNITNIANNTNEVLELDFQ